MKKALLASLCVATQLYSQECAQTSIYTEADSVFTTRVQWEVVFSQINDLDRRIAQCESSKRFWQNLQTQEPALGITREIARCTRRIEVYKAELLTLTVRLKALKSKAQAYN